MSASSIPRSYLLSTVLTLLLTVVATSIGLSVSGFYRDAPVLLPQVYGQDLLTLVGAVPALALATYYAARGSLEAYVAWLGVMGYLLYTYASYSFMTAFNELYLVYTTLLWLTLFTFVGGLVRLDIDALEQAVEGITVWPYIGFQLLLVVLVGFIWLSEIVPAILSGGTPPSIIEAGLPTSVIYSFDLGIILPAFCLTAYWLWQRRSWGYAFTGVLLVKATTLAAAVLTMAGFMLRTGQQVPLPLLVIFGGLFLISTGLTVQFLRTISPPPSHR